MSEKSKPDLWRYVFLALVVLLGVGNGVQYWRYQELEADHRALQGNVERWELTADKLHDALVQSKAEQEGKRDDSEGAAGE